jgi:hypothetical protein
MPSILSLLINPYLPEHTLPNSYDITLYGQAILYCKGMCSTTPLAPLRVCPSMPSQFMWQETNAT